MSWSFTLLYEQQFISTQEWAGKTCIFNLQKLILSSWPADVLKHSKPCLLAYQTKWCKIILEGELF